MPEYFVHFPYSNEHSATTYLTAVVGIAVALAEYTASRCSQNDIYYDRVWIMCETVLSD
jgi:hypothetical protein